GEQTAYSGLERSKAYRWFAHPESERAVYPVEDRDRQSHMQVASLRVAYGMLGSRSRAGELVDAILGFSDEFAQLWELHEVAERFTDHKTIIHPELGPIELDCQVLFTED